MRLLDRRAVGIAAVGPPARRDGRVGHRGHLAFVPAPDLVDREVLAGVLAGHDVAQRAELGEVPEAQRRAIDRDRPALADRHGALAEVPAGDVVAGIAQHLDLVEQRRDVVAPALIDEHPIGHVVIAPVEQPIVPPAGEPGALADGADGDEPQIEDPGARGRKVVVTDRGRIVVGIDQVRGEHDVVVLEQGLQRRKAGEQGGVRVEIDHRLGAGRAGLMEERPLHRRTDLDDIVLEQPAGEIRHAQIVGPDHPVERLAGRIEVEPRRRPVGDQRHKLPVGMETPHGLEQHPRPVEVREGEAGIAEHLHAWPSSRSTVRPLNARS